MNVRKYERMFSPNTKALKVFRVLKDRRWHCRVHEYSDVGSTQIAGSGGIQGLERGSTSRPGIVIDSENHVCAVCGKTTMHDRWTGNWATAVTTHTMPVDLTLRILALFGYKDAVDQSKRGATDLTIDHKFPMIRWPKNYGDADREDMSEEDIRARFQLLKKSNGTASHNHLKSRACENCLKTGKRGTPFGIRYFYVGDGEWRADQNDESGCNGCGWYDFDKWRKSLNSELRKHTNT